MAKYVYPAVLTRENDYYLVKFPDLKGCYTDGHTLAEAMEEAIDSLTFWLKSMEVGNEIIPEPSDIRKISLSPESIATLIYCDTEGREITTYERPVSETLHPVTG